jgi:hypothetical protein
MNQRNLIVLFALLLLCSGCNSTTPQVTVNPQSSNSAPASAAQKPATPPATAHKTEFMKAQKAFQLLLSAAHLWDMDAKPASLQSAMRKENPSDGSSCVWGLIVVSEKRKQINTFIWSGISAENAPIPGILGAKPAEYQSGNPNTAPFDPALLKIDSDVALSAAQKKNGAPLVNKEGSLLKYTLKYDTAAKQLSWIIGVGPQEDKVQNKIIVNATSGVLVVTQK